MQFVISEFAHFMRGIYFQKWSYILLYNSLLRYKHYPKTNWNSTKSILIKWSHCKTTTLIINFVDTDTIIFVCLSWQVEPFLDWRWWMNWMKERNLISVSKIVRSSFISEITHLIKSDINTQVQPSFTSKIQISLWYWIRPIC